MPPVSDSSSTPNARSIADAEAGLAALKQHDYPRAIALLETTLLPPEHPLGLKTQMGLVIAYTRNGNPQQAVNLCQFLYQNNSPQVKEWAARTLENLAKRYPQIPELEEFLHQTEVHEHRYMESQADETESQEDSKLSTSEADLTGFVPFDQASQRFEPTEADVTGFAPFEHSFESTEAADKKQQAEGREQRTEGRISELKEATRPVSRTEEALEPAPAPIPSETPSIEQPAYYPSWRQAERAKSWNPVGKVDIALPLLTQVVTAIALFWILQQVVYLFMTAPSQLLSAIPFLNFRHALVEPPVWPILILLVVLFIASRWLLDALLTVLYGLQPLSLSKLGNYSPGTVQSLNRFCRQWRLPMPALGILPTSTPIAFSYGFMPRVTRTVVSQGLLEQLADDEIATIYANEIGHIAYWDVPLMSLVMVVLQIPYTVYWSVAEWGNRQPSAILRVLASWVAALSYGVYWLLRWAGLWLSRQRSYNSDRIAANLTGNPNGLTRALLKIAIGTAQDVQQQGQTSYLLEGFDLLTPLGHQQATPLGSVYAHAPLEAVLEWDQTNPYRHWLSLSNSHPPTGDRLHRLAAIARQWRLNTELDLGTTPQNTARNRKSALTAQQWRTLLLQGAPFFGLGFGLVLAFALSLIGWVALRLNVNQISWLYGDPTILQGLSLIGLSLGTFIRINPLFPDAKPSTSRSEETPPSLVGLLKDPAAIPVDSLPVRLEGKLLGRSGISNLLSQDLLLQTPTGLVWLHCFSPLGPIGNLLPQENRFTDFTKQNVTATGWFRRGTTPWIDVDTLRTAGGRTNRSNHPLWSTILALLAAVFGIYIIFRGGIWI